MADWQHQTRIDLSSWIIHFVHERTPETSYEALINEIAEVAELEGTTIDKKNFQFPDYFQLLMNLCLFLIRVLMMIGS